MRRRVAVILFGLVAPWLAIAVAVAASQTPPHPNPCSVVVFKVTEDSLYAELQAPKGTTRCSVELK